MSHTYTIREQVDLSPHNTLRIPAIAERFITVTAAREIPEILRDSRVTRGPLHILGGGSNVLFLGDISGTVLHVAIKGREVVGETDSDLLLQVGAGENWHETVIHCVERGWGGTENLALIPGTVGAAPMQNIGAYGVELADIFHSLRAVDLETGETREFNREECRFGYRDSVFKQEFRGAYCIADVTLRLSKSPEINTSYGSLWNKLEEDGVSDPDIAQVAQAVMEIRRSKLPDPADLGNAGSFFKNPVVGEEQFRKLADRYRDMPHYEMKGEKEGEKQYKIPAGWLIEETGWKGKREGDVGTYRQQALVIVNHGRATGEEVWNLAQKIIRSVRDLFGIELVPEVNIIS